MNDTYSAGEKAPLLGAKRVRALGMTTLIFAVLGLLWLAWWGLVLSQREVTNNAYVAGHQVQVVAQTGGTVAAVHVEDTQRVQAEQILVELDPADAKLALQRAAANLARTVREVRQLRNTADLNAAMVTGRRLELAQAEDGLRRRLPLRDSRALSPEQIAKARTQVELAKSALVVAQKQAAAVRDLAGSGTITGHPSVLAARASYVEAWLALARTRIQSPVMGAVAQRTVQPGQQVQAGATLMRVVPAEGVWVDANLKEGQLQNLRIGQPVHVEVDLYAGSGGFKGRVAGFSAGTGSVFALLPPQNAAGNWVKVVQRVPVRIELDPAELAERPLLIGLSAEIKIDTHDRSGARIAAAVAPTNKTPTLVRNVSEAEQDADQIIAEHSQDSGGSP